MAAPREAAGAEREAEAGHFGQSPRDQRAAGVGTEAHAVGNAGRYGQHVLDRAADLDADDVVGRVGAEALG